MQADLSMLTAPRYTAPSTANPSWEVLALTRFLLACIVVSVHIRWFGDAHFTWAAHVNDLGGKAAVVGFLLISGFSIAASQQRRPQFYLRRRLMRIYPLYIVAMLFAAGLELTFGTVRVPGAVFESRGWLTIAGNFLMLQNFLVKPIAFDVPNWSLAIEFAFYVAAVFFFRAPTWLLWALVAVSTICFVLPIREDLGMVYYVASKLKATKYLWCWLLGYLLWYRRGVLTAAALALGAAAVFISAESMDRYSIATYTAVALIVWYGTKVSIKGSVGKVFNVLGDVSYPLYLFHLPVFILSYHAMGVRNSFVLVLQALAFSAVAHILVERLLVKHILKLIDRREQVGLRLRVHVASE